MGLFANLFMNNILPSFLVMGVGVLMDRTLRVDKRGLSRTAVYVLGPCLVFSAILESELASDDFGLVIVFALAITVVMCLLALGVGRLLGWSSRATDALGLSVALMNAGNFGLSVVLFSFGDAGVAVAIIFFVTTNLTNNTLGAYFAARGQGDGWAALRKVFRLPGIYAFVLAILLRGLQVQVPSQIVDPIALIGRAAVPIMLLLLGIRLSQTQVATRYREVTIGVVLRLAVGAGVAMSLAPLMGLHGLTRQVAIVEAATPSAVSPLLLAVEFGADAEYLSSVIFFSTLLSSVTLTALLAVLSA